MVEDNPGLLQLRMLQQLASSPGSSVVLSMPDGSGGPPNGGSGGQETRAAGARAPRTRSGVDRRGTTEGG
jgi:hypothetical protein